MRIMIGFLCVFLSVGSVQAGALDALKDLGQVTGAFLGGSPAVDEKTAVSGLKEALYVGTEKAVKAVARKDGYFGNHLIKILLPEQVQRVAEVASRLGYQRQVDDLIVSMNRAAEGAAPKATALFVRAVREMSFEDARGILQGGETAATEFFKKKTSAKLYEEFQPTVTASMEKVGTAKAYKNLTASVAKVPFLDVSSLDLDRYVTDRSIDGLFLMLGEEEKKIRTDPAARVTDLLKTVFGR